MAPFRSVTPSARQPLASCTASTTAPASTVPEALRTCALSVVVAAAADEAPALGAVATGCAGCCTDDGAGTRDDTGIGIAAITTIAETATIPPATRARTMDAS